LKGSAVEMLSLGNIRKQTKVQKGFTIAEVFIAAMLMVLASMGLLSLFNSSIQLSGISKEQKDLEQFARTVSERIRALPFYVPYAGANADIDDYFWGTAEQHGGDITHNSWESPDTEPYNPYVDCTLVTDPRFDCKVKIAYVEDNLTTRNMKSDWIPKAGESQQTKDKPLGTDNKPFNVIKYEVKVTWKVDVSHVSKGSYVYTSLVTSTQVQANLGVTAVTNIDSNSSKWGTGGQNSNTAPHTANALQIRISGYGFKPTGNIATFMKVGVGDMPVNNLTYVDSGTLTGTVDLNTGGSAAAPWQPRRDPGRWTMRVAEGVAYAYGYDVFTVEFPRPVITNSTPTSGKDSESAKSITATGTNVLNLGAGSSPYTAYCGATIRLVKDDNPDMIIYASDDQPITYGASGGYGVSNTVTAVFDLRNQTIGSYFVEIINCKDNRVEISEGNTISADNALYKFTVSAANPTPLKVYVTGSSGGEVYVAPGEKRPFAYRNRNYAYNLKVEGTDLGAIDTVRIGINGDPATGTSTDFVATATDVVASGDGTYLTCRADFKNVADSLAVTDTTYSWWVYVENSFSGSKGNLTNCFMVRKVRPIIYMDAQGTNIYHNTAPVNVTLYGECFEGAAYNIKYMPGPYAWNSPSNAANAYVVGVNDGGMVKGTPTSNGTVWQTQLNLIHVANGANRIWVESNDATPASDSSMASTFTSSEPRTYAFNVTVAMPAGATLNSQSTGAVTITNRFQDWWGTGKPGWVSAWRGPTANTENASAVANAQRSNTEDYFYWNIIIPVWTSHDEYGGAAFTLRGQGFADQIAGSTNVKVSYGSTTINQAGYSVTNPATRAAADTDRINKYVTVSTAEWQMPNTEAWGTITLGTTAHTNRFYIKQVLENTDT
jgi:hypothetical protein